MNNKMSLKKKAMGISIAVLVVFWTGFIFWFASTYYFQSPIKRIEYQCFLCRRDVTSTKPRQTVTSKSGSKPFSVQAQAPVSTPTPSISVDFEKAYDKVWLMESGRGNDKSGLNGECLAKGMINEIGYAPHDHHCFKDQVEQKATFMLWLKNRLEHNKMPWCNSINECLLLYSSRAYGF